MPLMGERSADEGELVHQFASAFANFFFALSSPFSTTRSSVGRTCSVVDPLSLLVLTVLVKNYGPHFPLRVSVKRDLRVHFFDEEFAFGLGVKL